MPHGASEKAMKVAAAAGRSLVSESGFNNHLHAAPRAATAIFLQFRVGVTS